MNKITLGIFAFAVVAMLGIGLISAQGGFGFKNMDEEEKAKFQEDREAERGAIESGDFEAWKSLMEERILRMQERLTEEEFTLIHERHKERSQNGEHAGGFGQGKGMGMHRGTGEGRRGGECPFADAE